MLGATNPAILERVASFRDGDLPEEYRLWQPRSIAFGHGGDLIVADRDMRIRVLTQTGEARGVFGAAGAGPGEFRQLAWAAPVTGDSVLAWDAELQRATVFSAAGGVARMYRPPEAGSFYNVVGALADGALVAFVLPVATGLEENPSWGRTPLLLLRGSAEGVARVDTLAVPVWLRCEPAAPGRCVPMREPAERRRGELAAAGGIVHAVPADGVRLVRFAADGSALGERPLPEPFASAPVERLLADAAGDAWLVVRPAADAPPVWLHVSAETRQATAYRLPAAAAAAVGHAAFGGCVATWRVAEDGGVLEIWRIPGAGCAPAA